jgi:hypothetical protein
LQKQGSHPNKKLLEHGNKGRKMSDVTKNLIVENRKWYKHSEETIKKIKESNSNRIKVWISQEEYIWL